MPLSQYHKRNETWQLSIRRFVFLLIFSKNCTENMFKMFCLQITIGGRQKFRKIVLKI